MTDNTEGFNVGILDALGSIQTDTRKKPPGEDTRITKVTKPRPETYPQITGVRVKISSSFAFQTTHGVFNIQLLNYKRKQTEERSTVKYNQLFLEVH